MTVSAHWRRAGCPVSCSAGAFEVENQFSVGSLRAGRDRHINIRSPHTDYRESTDTGVCCSGHKRHSARGQFRPYTTLSTNTVHVDVP